MRNLVYNRTPDASWYDDGLEEFGPRPAVSIIFGAVFVVHVLTIFAAAWLAAALFTAWA